MTKIEKAGFSRTLVAVAIGVAFSPAYAQDDPDMATLAKPDIGAVSAGGAFLSGNKNDRSLFGQYNGLRNDDKYLMLDLDYVRRDDRTGTWTILQGRNLGLQTRELFFQQERQGSWKLFGEYSELVRYYPRTINTGLQGAGTTTPVVNLLPAPGTGNNLDLSTKRKAFSLGGETWITPNFAFEASFKNEDKNGSRIFGRGFTCPSGAAPTPVCTALASGANQWALLLLPEPIDSTTRQFEAKLTYAGDRLALTIGYYGSFYENNNGSLNPTISGNLLNPLGNPMGQDGSVALTPGLRNILQLPMALPPDNQAHQVYASGNYTITPTTRANFKLAYTRATQKDDFLSNGLAGAPAGIANYGGRLDTTLAQVGLTARPFQKLAINANLRYEDRDDRSPLALYNIEGTNPFTNGLYSLKKTSAKLEGTYQLPDNYRATLGVDYDKQDRGSLTSPECVDLGDGSCVGTTVGGITALRAKTEEWSYRAELRKPISETMTGAVSFIHSDRDGSSWLKPNSLPATGTTPVTDAQVFNRTSVFPALFVNRKRDKVRFFGDWSPMDRLSVQLQVENGRDHYDPPSEKGLNGTTMQLYGVDVSYALSDNWKLTGYYSYVEQTQRVAHSTGYIADLKDRNNTLGLRLLGTPMARFRIGADVMWIEDRNIYAQALDPAASANNIAFLQQSGGLPNVTWRDLRLKLFGTYNLQKNSDIRFDIVHDRQRLNEWTWSNPTNGVPFVFSDNTTVSLNPKQNVTFVSASYVYRFR